MEEKNFLRGVGGDPESEVDADVRAHARGAETNNHGTSA
jgi:hypothetical protein